MDQRVEEACGLIQDEQKEHPGLGVEQIVDWLHGRGYSKMECLFAIKSSFALNFVEAQEFVHLSPTFAYRRELDEATQNSFVEGLEKLDMPETFAIPCVGAIIIRQVGGVRCLLIQERCKLGAGIENGMLEVAAGKVREYENVFDALRREVREETGLRLTHIEGEENAVTRTVNGYEVMSYTPFCTTQNLSGGYSILLHSFLCEAEGEPVTRTSETQNLRWMPLDDCRQLLQNRPEDFYPLHINALSLYLNKENP